MTNAQISLYCAPNLETFTQTVTDLRSATGILQEAAIAVQGKEVAFVLCGKSPDFTVVFAEQIDQQMSEDDLQLLAQGIVDYYHSQSAQSPRKRR